MGIYKVTAPTAVEDVEPGGILEHDFTAAEEADLLASHRLELGPREYRVIGPNRVCDTAPGGTFKGTYTVDQEKALLDGGHIERVSKPKAKPEATTEKPKAKPEATADKKE